MSVGESWVAGWCAVAHEVVCVGVDAWVVSVGDGFAVCFAEDAGLVVYGAVGLACGVGDGAVWLGCVDLGVLVAEHEVCAWFEGVFPVLVAFCGVLVVFFGGVVFACGVF